MTVKHIKNPITGKYFSAIRIHCKVTSVSSLLGDFNQTILKYIFKYVF